MKTLASTMWPRVLYTYDDNNNDDDNANNSFQLHKLHLAYWAKPPNTSNLPSPKQICLLCCTILVTYLVTNYLLNNYQFGHWFGFQFTKSNID